MVVVGVNGHPGAGKTVVSNMIFKYDSTKIIHLDGLFDTIKVRYFKNDLKVLEKDTGEIEPYIDSKSNIGKIKRLKYLRGLIEKLKETYSNIYIDDYIRRNKMLYRYLILEGRSLDLYHLDKYCDVKVFIHSSDKLRYTRMVGRTIKGLSLDDIKSIYQYDLGSTIPVNDYLTINNNGDMKELEEQVNHLEKTIIKKIGV